MSLPLLINHHHYQHYVLTDQRGTSYYISFPRVTKKKHRPFYLISCIPFSFLFNTQPPPPYGHPYYYPLSRPSSSLSFRLSILSFTSFIYFPILKSSSVDIIFK